MLSGRVFYNNLFNLINPLSATVDFYSKEHTSTQTSARSHKTLITFSTLLYSVVAVFVTFLMLNSYQPCSTMRDELISIFLGSPEVPTKLGYQLLVLTDEAIAVKISMILRQKSNDILSLEEVTRQFNPPPALFVQSYARLLKTLLEWKKNAALCQNRHVEDNLTNSNRCLSWYSCPSQQSFSVHDRYTEQCIMQNGFAKHALKCKTHSQDVLTTEKRPLKTNFETNESHEVKDISSLSLPMAQHSSSFVQEASGSNQGGQCLEHLTALLKAIPHKEDNHITGDGKYQHINSLDNIHDSNHNQDVDHSFLYDQTHHAQKENVLKSFSQDTTESLRDVASKKESNDLEQSDLTNNKASVRGGVHDGRSRNQDDAINQSRSPLDKLKSERIVNQIQASESTPTRSPTPWRTNSSPLIFKPPPPPNASPILNTNARKSYSHPEYNNALDLLQAVAQSLTESMNKTSSKAFWETSYERLEENHKERYADISGDPQVSDSINQGTKDSSPWLKLMQQKSLQAEELTDSSSVHDITGVNVFDTSKTACKLKKDSEVQEHVDLDGDSSTKASSRRYSIRTSEGGFSRPSLSSSERFNDIDSPCDAVNLQQKYFILQGVVDVLFGHESKTDIDKGFGALQKLYSVALALNTVESIHLPISKLAVMLMAERASSALTLLIWNIAFINKKRVSQENGFTLTSNTNQPSKKETYEFSTHEELPYEIQQLPHILTQIDLLAEESGKYVEDQWNSRVSFLCRSSDEKNIINFLDVHSSSVSLESKPTDFQETLAALARIDVEVHRCAIFKKHATVQKKIREAILQRMCSVLH